MVNMVITKNNTASTMSLVVNNNMANVVGLRSCGLSWLMLSDPVETALAAYLVIH